MKSQFADKQERLQPLIAVHPDIAFDLHEGGQPHYHFILSAE